MSNYLNYTKCIAQDINQIDLDINKTKIKLVFIPNNTESNSSKVSSEDLIMANSIQVK